MTAASTVLLALVMQSSGVESQQFLVDHWTSADGLPVNSINSLHLSPSGYLWMTTFDGLVRFDGHRFETFASIEAGHRLGRLLESPDGLLWVGSDTWRISSFDGRNFRNFGVVDGLPGNTVLRFRLDSAGVLWTMGDRGLARRVGTRFEVPMDIVGLGIPRDFLPVENEGVWLATDLGVHRWRGGEWRTYGAEHGVPLPANTLAMDADGRLWVGGGALTVRQVDEDRFATATAICNAQRIDFLDANVAMICGHMAIHGEVDGSLRVSERSTRYFASGGELLLARSADGSLWRNRIDALTRDGQVVFESDSTIHDFVFDGSGAVWVSTAADGLFRLRPRHIGAVTELAGRRLGAVYGMAEAEDGALWLATMNQGVVVMAADGEARWLSEEENVVHQGIQTIFLDGPDHAWVGSCRMDPDQGTCAVAQDLPARAGRGNEIRALHRDADGSLWVGGLSLWRQSPEGTWESPESGLSTGDSGHVRVILETSDGTLWFGTRGDGLLRRARDGTFHLFNRRDGLASNAVRGLLLDRDDQIWVATEDLGLCRMRDPEAIRPQIACLNTSHGLWSNSLHRVLVDDDDRFWINSNHGVFAVARQALNDVMDGRSARVHPLVFTERDGLPDREGNGGVQQAGLRLRDGRIAFPTQNGVALIDPAKLRAAAEPVRAVFEEIELPDGRRLGSRSPVLLERGERSLALRYTGLSPAFPAPVYFRYRLLPDERWTELGDARRIPLSRLPPGQHTLELMAFESGGSAGPPAQIALTLPPYLHETATFRIAVPLFLACLALAWLMRERRLGRERRDQLEVTVAERTEDLRGALDTVNSQRDEIERLANAKTRFFANVSHELRTPLTLISGPLRDAERGAPLTQRNQRLMLGNAQRLERLVTQLLDLERIDAGCFPLHRQPGDLCALVRETVDAFLPLAAQQGVAIGADLHGDPLSIDFDADQMARLLGNLLSNALKFTPSGGRIDVCLEDSVDRVQIVVADTGPGVPEEARERIFDRFSQVGSEATRSREGAGLGLAVCREIAHLHGGHLWVEGNAGGGARFVLDLPRDESPSLAIDRESMVDLIVERDSMSPTSATQERASSAERTDDEEIGSPHPAATDNDGAGTDGVPATARRRILVAEDHPDLRAYIVAALAHEHELMEAEDGEAALILARQALPDLVISDVMMPRRDGFGLARALRATPETAGIPLIFLTARAGVGDEIEGLASGADQYLRKPFDTALLRAHVAAALHAVERLRRRFAVKASHAPAPERNAAANPRGDADRRFLEAAERWFERHLHDESATVQGMAAALHVSHATLGRRFARLEGESPQSALRRRRLDRARALLEDGEGSVSEVAYAVGYASLAAFSRAFREHHGHAPSQAVF